MATATLREAIEALMAQPVLVLPADFDRRGMYFVATSDRAPPPSSGAAPHSPDTDDATPGPPL